MTRICFYKMFLINENKDTELLTPTIEMRWLYKCDKIYEDYIKFVAEHVENIKSAERQKTGFPKE